MSETLVEELKNSAPLSAFKEDSAAFLTQLRTTARPLTLTVDGRPEAILQSPSEYQRLLDLAAAADASEGIRQGLEQLRQGQGRPAAEFFAELHERYGLPR